MPAAATLVLCLAGGPLPEAALGEIRRAAETSGLPYRLVASEWRAAHREPPRGAGTPWHVLVTAKPMRGTDLAELSAFDDVVSLASDCWHDDLAFSLAWVGRVSQLAQRIQDEGIIGISEPVVELRKQMAHAILDRDASVLVVGETGTGKRVVAEALHHADDARAGHPFHCLDAGAVVPGLFGSELFGHVRGSFTGATESRPGAIRTAGEGTLLLDEVGELPTSLQASLLSVLQQRSYRAVGSDHEHLLKCRIVSATNRDLQQRVAACEFREDLKHRLSQIVLRVPPLRERREDLPMLANALIRRYRSVHPPQCAVEVLEYLQGLSLRGNVRELEAMLRYATVRASDAPTLRLTHLPRPRAMEAAPESNEDVEPLEQSLAVLRKTLVSRALQHAARDLPAADRTVQIAWAAERLQISARSVYNYLNGEARRS
ncbi:sigma 54-interacting transcriptional regulator [Variovorax sp. J22P240]|uniref:sigma 54-interacting transcriptional regulator n=1 Tax=Variovorax sp. J22P240 TaxID=3053514 RepID=UPI002575E078|nr:sigma 54-interacting transcriptional regulator [Variovorax sp. J22P240]MDL9998320.1 sigma 54-interacting transcriptional regulator [Variovorax sp. J22P240]